jgi:hypothetical protein
MNSWEFVVIGVVAYVCLMGLFIWAWSRLPWKDYDE